MPDWSSPAEVEKDGCECGLGPVYRLLIDLLAIFLKFLHLTLGAVM